MTWKEQVDVAIRALELDRTQGGSGFAEMRDEAIEVVRKALRGENPQTEKLHEYKITTLAFTARSRNQLTKAGIVTVGDLCKLTWEDLIAIEKMGVGSAREVRRVLRSLGTDLAMVDA